MQDENQLDESDNQVLHFNRFVQSFHQYFQIGHSKACSAQLNEQHDLVKPWEPLEIEVDEVLYVISASQGAITVVPEVCKRKESKEIKDEPTANVVLCDSFTIPVNLAVRLSEWGSKNADGVHQVHDV